MFLLLLWAAANPAVGQAGLLSWANLGQHRIARVYPQGTLNGGFTLLPPTLTGICFTNLLPEHRHLTNQILPNGAGVAAGDIDGDGLCDLYFCGLKDSDNQLYKNLGGWRFTNVTEQAGVSAAGLDCTGAAFADIDGDGDLDLLVNTIGAGTRIYVNNGQGRFTMAGLLNNGFAGTSLGLADADGDGDLDMYIANYRVSTLTDMPGARWGIKRVNDQWLVTSINGRPLTDPDWTNRFRFKFEVAPGGRGKFGHEELGEPDAFFLNDGRGGFTHAPFTSGRFLGEDGRPLTAPLYDWGLSVLFRDLNGDGAPDLYVCNDFGTPDRLWLNDGRGNFKLAPWFAIRQTSLASMAVDSADLDRDGHDDLVVLDMLAFGHQRRLTQRNILRAELAPVFDVMARPQYPRNTLLWNRGDGTYAEIAQYAGIEGSEWSWNPVLLDVDLDGFEDLLVPNGFVRDNMDIDSMNRIMAEKARRKLTPLEELHLRAIYPPLYTPNIAFRNMGNLRFTECSHEWGFDQTTISQGICLADFDNDGDLDLAVNNLNHPAALYRNDSSAPRIGVRLRGRPPNTAGIGARITVSGGPVTQSQVIVCGGRYCSSDQAQRTFAAGKAESLTVQVEWPSGMLTVISNVPPNHLVEVLEPPSDSSPSEMGSARTRKRTAKQFADQKFSGAAEMRFVDVSDRLGHVHHDPAHDDFERQPLLSRKLGQLGPGVAWWDIDKDGRDDLVIGSGRDGQVCIYRISPALEVERLASPALAAPVDRDTTGMAGLRHGELLMAFSNYEDCSTNGSGVVRLGVSGMAPVFHAGEPAYGPLAVADYNCDGYLDLFIGARVMGGKYPVPVRSVILKGTEDGFVFDALNTRSLPEALVSGAVWTDLTGDGWPELVLACEWGPLVILRNDKGNLSRWNARVEIASQAGKQNPKLKFADGKAVLCGVALTNLGQLTGWWNGVCAGDFDNDGRLDLLASNWGQNTRYERWRDAPLRVYFGDFDRDGTVELFETHFVPELNQFCPERMLDVVMRALPQIGERFPTHHSWSTSGIDHVLGEWRATARTHEALWLESTVFLNRGDHFEVRLLPREAQFAPAFGVCVGDADADGNEDVFLSQNFFGVDLDTSRYDSGRGLWLRGDGSGNLEPVPGHYSGVIVYGEQRGAALCDFDGDGRVDLAVSQNNGQTKLFQNTSAKAGLRVRIQFDPGNPCGIGAVVRLRFGDKWGPAREVHGGSGYWSQDSPVLVMGCSSKPTSVQVRWPGGRVTESAVPPGAGEIRVLSDGKVETLRR